jgi:chitinase
VKVLALFLATALAAAPFKPTLKLTPRRAVVAKGGTVSFSALINYEPDGPRFPRQPVRWTVAEGEAGGTITHAGVYTAPDKAGTYHVRAEREDHPGVAAKAKVVVK